MRILLKYPWMRVHSSRNDESDGCLYCIHNPDASILKRHIILDELIDVTHQNGTYNSAWWPPCQIGSDIAVCLYTQHGNWRNRRLCSCCCLCPLSRSISCMHLDPHRVSCSGVHSYIHRRFIKVVYCSVSIRSMEAVITSILEKVVLRKRKRIQNSNSEDTVTRRLWLRSQSCYNLSKNMTNIFGSKHF